MINLTIDELIFEVKEEIICYEELGAENANKWEKDFRKWVSNPKIKKVNMTKFGGKDYYTLKDESGIFDIVDEYYNAFANNKLDEYWKNFQ